MTTRNLTLSLHQRSTRYAQIGAFYLTGTAFVKDREDGCERNWIAVTRPNFKQYVHYVLL